MGCIVLEDASRIESISFEERLERPGPFLIIAYYFRDQCEEYPQLLDYAGVFFPYNEGVLKVFGKNLSSLLLNKFSLFYILGF